MTQTLSPQQKIDRELFIQNYGSRTLTIVKGKGCWAWDENGDKYLDCTSGIAVNAFGHNFEPVIGAIKSQAEKLLHCSNLYMTQPQQVLAELLIRNTALQKVFFCNSGTEAVEAALKFARKYQAVCHGEYCSDIISFEQSFHGRTYGALAATGQPALQKYFGPMPPSFVRCPMNDIHALDSAINQNTAAIIIEPILMEGGIITPETAFVQKLGLIQKKGVLIIADEIQTGLGRTGRILASQSWSFTPDIVVLAKSLGGGLPLGAVLVNDKLADVIKLGDHGSTFGGNPVCCAAGAAVLSNLLSPGFLESISNNALYFRQILAGFAKKYQRLGFSPEILGEGFLCGLNYSGDLPGFMTACTREGLLVLKAGKKVLRLLPPLNIKKSECDLVVSRLQKAVEIIES